MKKVEKFFWITLGFLSILMALLAAILPFIPAAPFYIFALACFSKSSKKLHDKFFHSVFYQKYLHSYVTKHALHLSTKIIILLSITITIAISIYSLQHSVIAISCLIIAWIMNLIYFIFIVKTI